MFIKVERKGKYQGIQQWGITGSAEITPSKATAEKWALLESASLRPTNVQGFKYGMSAEQYDYKNQAWIGADGRYIRCGHPEDMDCRCYDRVHAGELAFSEHCPLCGHSPVYKEDPKEGTTHTYYCHGCNQGFDIQVSLFPCPECEVHLVRQPLARQKMYRHLLGHGYTESEAEEIALTIPDAYPSRACGCPFCSDCIHMPEGWDG